jgi:hypothetical protein
MFPVATQLMLSAPMSYAAVVQVYMELGQTGWLMLSVSPDLGPVVVAWRPPHLAVLPANRRSVGMDFLE